MSTAFDARVLQTWATYFALPIETLRAPGTSLFINPRRGAGSYLILWPVGHEMKDVVMVTLPRSQASQGYY